jgi:CheY-like chemotaxis protein
MSRVLLVEDTPLRVDWFLEQYGPKNLDWTDDPAEAIKKLQTTAYDRLHLDHDLGRPESGRDVTLWLVQHPDVQPGLRIVTHTHNQVSGAKIERECLAAGRPCVWKPFGTWQLEDLDTEVTLAEPGQWRPTTASHMLRAWGVAELRSPRGSQALQAGLISPQLLDALHHQHFDTISPEGWAAIEDAVIAMRGQLVSSLLHLELRWYERELDLPGVQALRFFNLPEWQQKWPSQMLVDLAGERDPARTEPEFHGLETSLEPYGLDTSLERLIAVGATLRGPFCLVEGYTRAATWLRDKQAGLAGPETLPFLIGISPHIAVWAHPRGHKWWPKEAE